MPHCHQCAQEFEIDPEGVAHHVKDDGEIDFDVDADHVPYELENETFLSDPYELGDYGGPGD
jgi:hypothetical protein